MTSTGTPQTPTSDASDPNETTGIVTFTLDTSTMALGRYRSKFFLVHASEHGLEPGKRFHSALNVVSWHSNRHSKKGPKVTSFWLNCSRGNGNADDPDGICYQLLHTDPSMVRRTGRKRKEVSADDGAATIDCYEFEVLVPEEGLIRQCYYCLSWEDGERRYSQMKHDKYWCSSCKRKGRLLSTITPKEKLGVRVGGDPHPIERDNIYA